MIVKLNGDHANRDLNSHGARAWTKSMQCGGLLDYNGKRVKTPVPMVTAMDTIINNVLDSPKLTVNLTHVRLIGAVTQYRTPIHDEGLTAPAHFPLCATCARKTVPLESAS